MELESALRDESCSLCKETLLVIQSMIGDTSSRRRRRSDAAAPPGQIAPIAYYFECNHWVHVRCVQRGLIQPATNRCGACITETRRAEAGIFKHALLRIQGIPEIQRLDTGPSNVGSARPPVRSGSHSAINVGDNHLVNDMVRGAIKRDEQTRVDQMRKDTDASKRDDECFGTASAVILRVVSDRGIGVLADDVSLARKNTEELRVLVGEFMTSDMTLWGFLDENGTIDSLLRLGVTWDQLCTFGLSETRMTESGFGIRDTQCLWPGYKCVPRLCDHPLFMHFGMFFKDVCGGDFEVLRQLMIPESHLLHMGFSFLTYRTLFIRQPLESMRAFQHIDVDVCVTKFQLSRALIKDLRSTNTASELMTFLYDRFSSWQLI